MAVDMSSEELRSHLFRSLQGRGVLDSLKSQLRNRLATELQRSLEASVGPTPTGQASSSPPAANKKGNSMILQVANSIVVEHLKRAGYEYTLSVFLPEAGVNVDKVFSYEEILQFLKISDQTLHQALLSDQKQGFLLQLLEGLVAHGVSPNKASAATQTEEQQSHRTRSSVAAKLQALDESYAHKAAEESIKCHQALEERMTVFQRECEVRYQRQLKTEMAHFRERELAQARCEERERWREEVGRERKELQETHRRKMEAMRRMELETLERLRRKEQDLEAGVYSQRQALLSELDALKVREVELKRQEELNKKAASLEKEHAKALMEQLASKERALQQMKEHYEQMAEERVQKYCLECEGQHQSKRDELMKWELELTAKQERLSVLESECQRVGGELREERGRVERLQELLHDTTSKQVALQQQKDVLQQRLAQMSNYPQLEQKISELQQQLWTTEQRLSEIKMEHKRKSSEQQQLIKQLQTKFSRPSSEQLALRAELEQLGKTHHKEMLVVQYENQQLRKHLTVHSERSLQLQRQLDEQTVQLRSAQREVNDLHSQLQHLQSAALLLGRREPQSGPRAKRSVHNSKRIASTAPHIHTSGPPKLTPHPIPVAITPHLHKLHPYDSDGLLGTFDHNLNFPDMSGQFLEETRAAFTRLEMEAEELEQSYQQFQHQVATGYVAAPHLREAPSPPYYSQHRPPVPPLVSSVASPPAAKTRTTPLAALPSHTSPLSDASFLQQGEAAVIPIPTLTMVASSAPTALLATVAPSHSLTPHTTDTPPASHTPSVTSVAPSYSLTPHTMDMPPASHTPSITSVAPSHSITPHTTDMPPASHTLSVTSVAPTHSLAPHTTDIPPASHTPSVTTAVPSPPLASLAPSSTGKPDGTQLSPSPTGITTTPLLSTSETFSGTHLPAQSLTSTVPVIKTPVSLRKGHILPTATTAPPVFAGTTVSQTTRDTFGVHDSSPAQNTVEAAQRAIKSPESVPSVAELSESRGPLEETTSAQSRADLASAPIQSLQTVPSQVQVISAANPSPRISLDDVWKTSTALQVSGAGVMEILPATSSLLPSSKLPSEVLESSWDLRRRWRQEERERRQREEEEEVRKELETMEREQQQQEQEEVVQGSPPSPSSPPPKPSGPDAEPKHGDLEPGLGGEPVKDDEDQAIDPVMLKYMELVKQRRKHSRTEDNLDPPVERVEPEPKSAEDYGLPPLSQGSESFGGFSDHGDNPFEDW